MSVHSYIHSTTVQIEDKTELYNKKLNFDGNILAVNYILNKLHTYSPKNSH